MPRLDPSLTPTQLEILDAVWSLGDSGGTVAAVWQAVGEHRDLARTTVLTQLQRLHRKGWLRRGDADGVATYRAAIARDEAGRRLAKRFVGDFFAGSAAGLVKSLLGGGRVDRAEVARLRKVLDDAEAGR